MPDHDRDPGRAPVASRVPGWLLPYGLAAALVVAGVAVATFVDRQPSFGWFAYAPAQVDVLTDLAVWSRPRVIAALLIGVGLLLAAVTTGRLLRGQGPTTRTQSALPAAAAVAGVLLVGVGLAAFRWLPGEPAPTSVTISRYDELPPAITLPLAVWTPHQVLAAAVSAAGVLVIAVVLGYGRTPNSRS